MTKQTKNKAKTTPAVDPHASAKRRAARKEQRQQAADFTQAINNAIAPHVDLVAAGHMSRAVVADVASERVAMTLAGSWGDVDKHKAETIAKHGQIVESIVDTVAHDVWRLATRRREAAWKRLASCLAYVSVREKTDRSGSTYHSAQIVYTDSTVQRIGETYGYGSHWCSTVADVLRASPAGARLPPGGNGSADGYGAVSRRVASTSARHDVVTIARNSDHYQESDRG